MKKLTALLLAMILTLGILPFGVSASENIYVTVDGATLNFDQPPIMQNDRVLVPMRLIFESLGATVEWDDRNQFVKATKEDTTITMQIGNETMVKNGEYITLDTAPILLNGRTLVPVRAVAESLDATVEWRGEINTVVIEKKVIPKRYATETLLAVPGGAHSIVTDLQNNIYYIDSVNRIMEFNNGLTRVVCNVEEEYADFAVSSEIYGTQASDDGFVPYDPYAERFYDGRVSFLTYDDKNDRLLAGITCKTGFGYCAFVISDITNKRVISGDCIGKNWQTNDWRNLGNLNVIDNNKLFFTVDDANYRMSNLYQVDLITGQIIERSSDNRASREAIYGLHSFAIINNKFTGVAFGDRQDNHKIVYYQYNVQNDNYDSSVVPVGDNKTLDIPYFGTDGVNFYFIENSNIYRIPTNRQVELWVSVEEIDFQDQVPLYAKNTWPQLTFDREGNILFYDISILSIRRLKKLN